MKQPKWFRQLIIVMIAVITCFSLIFFSSPLDAKTKSLKQMVDLGLIDKITPSEELKFDYLHKSPLPLDLALMRNVRLADREAAQLPENGLVGIPLGSLGPIPVSRDLPALKRTMIDPGRYVAVGEEVNGHRKPFFTSTVRNMFAMEERLNGFGGFSQDDTDNEQIVADASGSFLEARRPIVHDIVIRDLYTERLVTEEDVLMSAICRETLNAFLNGTYFYYGRY